MISEGYRSGNGAAPYTGVGRGGEERRGPSGFRVVASGHETIHAWLDTNRRFVASGLSGDQGTQPEVFLGDVEFGGSLYSKLSAKATVDMYRRAYTLAVAFYPPEPGAIRLDRRPHQKPAPFDFPEFWDRLVGDPSFADRYSAGTTEPSGSLVIRQVDGGEQTSFVFKTYQAGSDENEVGHTLSIREAGLEVDNINRVGIHLDSLADLTRRIVEALYPAHNLDVPDEPFFMRPPRGSEKTFKQSDDRLNLLLEKWGIQLPGLNGTGSGTNGTASNGNGGSNTGQYL